MNSTEIEFTIQKLNGETFSVSIPRSEGEKFWQKSQNLYNNYGLDTLNDVISKHNGTDPVTQQLFCEKELTISESLIPLSNQLITLIIKPSFYIEFALQANGLPMLPGAYLLVDNILSGLHISINWAKVCYLHCPAFQNMQIQVIGQYRDFFKIATQNMPQHFLRVHYNHSEPYIINSETPKYVWLRYDKRSMKKV
jgi:hypothetical protein